MLQKFIWWTGLSDFLVGAGTWFGAVTIAMAAEPVKGQVVPVDNARHLFDHGGRPVDVVIA